jgi:hypothetical protein
MVTEPTNRPQQQQGGEHAWQPFVGADTRIFAGAVLSGPIRVGDNAVVGHDVPARAMVWPTEVALNPLPESLSEGFAKMTKEV